MKGYKVFNSDWTCRGFKYEVGKTYTMEEKPVICERGFHFCEKLVDCFNYYSFNPENKVAEIEATGDIDTNGEDKCCTNNITIVKELTWIEVLTMVNFGKDNTGFKNSGDWNSGNWNSGNRNSGNRNSGDRNSGNRNSGDRNSGDWNSGYRNSGDWNSGDYNVGIFNTINPLITIFNEPSDWTMDNWYNSKAYKIMCNAPTDTKVWVEYSEMTKEEKAENPNAKVTDGYLKHVLDTENRQKWWDGLSEEHKNEVMSLPNFDAEIFEQCTGIKVNKTHI